VIDPHAVGTRHPDLKVRAIVALVIAITERPWSITHRDAEAARAAGLDDASILQVVLQASNFGHLNRLADAVGVEADYPNSFGAPQIEPATPPYLWPVDAPPVATGRINLALREAAAEPYAAWQAVALGRDSGMLDRRRRSVIASAVAARLGDRAVPATAVTDEIDHVLVELADIVTLAPWRLGPAAYQRVRELGFVDDADVFDVIATASSCTVFSRIATVLAGLAR
jgi:alkylhydroperoxidase/carboxymuconolactone decarboxylase family protein YurZ